MSTTPAETANLLYDSIDKNKLDLTLLAGFDSELASFDTSDYIVDEDWNYDLSSSFTAKFKAGSLVLKYSDSGLSFRGKTGVKNFVETVSTYGFSSQLMEFEKATLKAGLHADRRTVWGDISGSGELRLQFSQDVDNAHTILEAFGGHFDLVFGVGVLITFPAPELPKKSPKKKTAATSFDSRTRA